MISYRHIGLRSVALCGALVMSIEFAAGQVRVEEGGNAFDPGSSPGTLNRLTDPNLPSLQTRFDTRVLRLRTAVINEVLLNPLGRNSSTSLGAIVGPLGRNATFNANPYFLSALPRWNVSTPSMLSTGLDRPFPSELGIVSSLPGVNDMTFDFRVPPLPSPWGTTPGNAGTAKTMPERPFGLNTYEDRFIAPILGMTPGSGAAGAVLPLYPFNPTRRTLPAFDWLPDIPHFDFALNQLSTDRRPVAWPRRRRSDR